jgi:hypothetical protein
VVVVVVVPAGVVVVLVVVVVVGHGHAVVVVDVVGGPAVVVEVVVVVVEQVSSVLSHSFVVSFQSYLHRPKHAGPVGCTVEGSTVVVVVGCEELRVGFSHMMAPNFVL